MLLGMSELYQVEKIIGKRITQKGKIQYKVKWQGYSQSESTWQPSENLIYVKQMIKNYESKLKQGGQENNNEADSGQFAQTQQQIQEEINFHVNQEQEENNVQKQDGNNNQVVQFEESEHQRQKRSQQGENQEQIQIESEEKSNQSVFQTRQVEEDSYSDESRPRKKKKTSKNNLPQQMPKLRQNSFLNSALQNSVPRKKIKTDTNFKSENDQTKKSIKSTLQKIEENMRHHQKNKEAKNQQRKELKNIKPKVTGLNYNDNDDKQFMYLTQVQGLISYKPREYMIVNWPEELIKYYQGMIDFSEIPKIAR